MRVRAFLGFLMLLTGGISYAMQPSPGAPVSASVENIRFEKDSHAAFVRVVNNSGKDITAFNLSVDVNLQNGGHTHFEQMIDLLPLMLTRQSLSGASVLGEGSLRPEGRQEVRLDFPNEAAQSVHAKVDMVAYLDLSTEVDGNQDALSRLVSWRKGRALAAQQAAELINGAAADSVTPDPSGMAINGLKKLLDEAIAQHSGERELELRSTISDLQAQRAVHPTGQTSLSRAQADLRDYARLKSREAEAASSHAGIRTNNPGQESEIGRKAYDVFFVTR